MSKNKSKSKSGSRAHIKSIFIKSFLTVCVFTGGVVCGIHYNKITYFFKRTFCNPTVSVLMSTYNRSEALPNAIESILDQTYTDFEFIIINDGSSDDTDAQIKHYAEKDPRIVYLKNEENKGLIYSLNRGLDVARGKYVVRMDDDDKSVPFRLERQVWAMDVHPEITIMGAGILGTDSKPQRVLGIPKIHNTDEIELNTYFSSGLAHPTIIIRRDFLEKHKIRYDMAYTYAEDCGLYKDVMAKGGRISAMHENVLYFGYVKGLTKPKKYSYIQGESFKKVQKEKLKPFFDAPYEMLGAFTSDEVRCQILKKMAPVNKTKKILNQTVLENRIEQICRPYETPAFVIDIQHPYWKDKFALDETRKKFYRLSTPNETGKIVNEDEKTVTISWDNWDEEVYEKETPEKWVYLKNQNGMVKK